MDVQRLARIPIRMKAFVDQGKAAGIVTMVVRHGRLASLDAVGYQDLATKTPMRTDSIFRIRSMTKPVTSVALITLMEDGLLALTVPVEKYLPEFHGQQVKVACPAGSAETSCVGKPSRAMTLFDLLTHTSGVASSNNNPKTLAERVATLAHLPMDFEPEASGAIEPKGSTRWGASSKSFRTCPTRNLLPSGSSHHWGWRTARSFASLESHLPARARAIPIK